MPYHKSLVDWLTMRGTSSICRTWSRKLRLLLDHLDAAGLALQLLWSNGYRRYISADARCWRL